MNDDVDSVASTPVVSNHNKVNVLQNLTLLSYHVYKIGPLPMHSYPGYYWGTHQPIPIHALHSLKHNNAKAL